MIVRIGKRLGWLVFLWLLAGFFGAALVWMAPGFGIDERELDPRWTKDSIVALRADEAERRGPVSFYLDWLSHVARGDLGHSYSLGRPVAELLRERLPTTLQSAALGLLCGWVAGLMLAVSTYFVPMPAFDWGTTAAAGILLCLPSGLVAVLFLMLDAPVWCAIATVVLPQVFSYTRNLCSRVLEQPHVLMAAAKGVGRARIFFWHVLWTIWPQMLALAGVTVTLAFTASIPIEVICDSPGVGQLAWLAAMGRDLPLLVNITLIVTAITLAANSLSDWATSVSGIEGAAR
ncbi:MAG: ABC transporter permease [bacterium]|nr:ABC transporter permease [bacterium]